MQILKTFQLLEYLDYLIRNAATGNPKQLATKLRVSERQTYRLIEELRLIGFPINYSRYRTSYYYDEDILLKIELVISGRKIVKISGSN